MLIVYGLSKGFMSAIADKSNPKTLYDFRLNDVGRGKLDDGL